MTTLRKALEALRRIPHGIETATFSTFARETDTETDFRYGQDFNAEDFGSASLVSHRHLSGSDYSGGALIRANQKEALEMAPGLVVRFHGGLNTLAVFFRLDVESDEAPAVAEMLAGLDDYPAVSDDSLSAQEHEEETEAWENYAAADFLRSLETAHGIERGDLDVEKETLAELFYAADGGSGLVEHNDEGPYFDTDRAAERIAAPLLFYSGKLSLGFEETLSLARGDMGEALRLLRLVRIGSALRALTVRVGSIMAPAVDPEDGPRIGQGRRSAHEALLRAKFDAGDTGAPLDAAALENVPCRSFSVTFDRYVGTWGSMQRRELRIVLDPFDTGGSVYDGGKALADFLSQKETQN